MSFLLPTEESRNKYIDFWVKIMQFERFYKVYPIDFKKSWTQIYWIHKYQFLAVLSLFAILPSLLSYIPILVSDIFETQDYDKIWFLTAALIGSLFLNFVAEFWHAPLELNAANSVMRSAFETLIKSDPNNHITNSRGIAVSKINRIRGSIISLYDIILFNLIRVVASLGVLLFSFYTFDFLVGLATSLFLALFFIINTMMRLVHVTAFQPRRNYLADKYTKILSESLNQILYIRSIFATKEQVNKIQNVERENMITLSTAWISRNFLFRLMTLFSNLFWIGLTIYFLGLVRDGSLQPSEAVAFILVYISGFRSLAESSRQIQRFFQSKEDIENSFQYIRNFGEQSYPVLEGDQIPQ